MDSKRPYYRKLSLMSFNIRYGTADDGANSWPMRRDQVFALIEDPALDAIGLQECLAFQLEEILDRVPGYACIGVGRDDGRDGGEFSPILYRTSRFRERAGGAFWFSDTPEVPGSASWGNRIPRICTWATLTERAGEGAFHLFNVHLDHGSQPSRERSAVYLIQRIQAMKPGTEPVFILGDFNADDENPALRYLKGERPLYGKDNPMPFRDSFDMLHSGEKNAATFHAFTGIPLWGRIDNIFITPGAVPVKADIVRTQVNGRFPSDHFPVTATLDLTGSSGSSPPA
ncbi:MAG: exodeoxyribonuclease [Fibrobacteres bacterium]|nr:exodeoxyribonuclease [Fibrobacterota bacterium]